VHRFVFDRFDVEEISIVLCAKARELGYPT
jgi:hypothetical protein